MTETPKRNTVAVSTKDLYQLLLAECRYGYSRNNHLMPSGSYSHVWAYLDKLEKADHDCAMSTAEQLCEECISDNLNMNFWDGVDDECGNRQEAFDFIEKLLRYIHKYHEGWVPYNYDNFVDNKAKDDEPRYDIYELGEQYKDEDFYAVTEKARNNQLRVSGKPLNKALLAKSEIMDFIFEKLEKLPKNATIVYNRVEIRPDRFGPTGDKYKSVEDWHKDFKTLYKIQDKLYVVVRGDK